MSIEIRQGGAWREVSLPYAYPNPNDPRVVEEAFYRDGGIWKRVFVNAPDAVASLTKTGDSYTSVSFSWAAVPTAASYEIYRNDSLLTTVTGTSYTNSGLSQSTTYNYKVRAKNAYGGLGDFSPTYAYFTGRPEVRDQGSKNLTVNPVGSNSHRGDVGWGYVGDDVRQGYFSQDYGSGGYSGVVDYGSNGVLNAIRSACGGGTTGTNRQLNGTCSLAQVYLYKETGVGSGGAVTATFYTSDSARTGGQPNREGAAVSITTTSGGAGKWYNIGTAHGQRLGDAGSRSVVIYRNSSSDYLSFRGASGGGSHCDLNITWAWNYVTQTAQTRTWTQV